MESLYDGKFNCPVFILNESSSKLLGQLTGSEEYRISDIKSDYKVISDYLDGLIPDPDMVYYENNFEPAMNRIGSPETDKYCLVSLAPFGDYSVIECMNWMNLSQNELMVNMISMLKPYGDFLIFGLKDCAVYVNDKSKIFVLNDNSDMNRIQNDTSYPLSEIFDSLKVCPIPSKCSNELKITFP